MSNVYCCVYGCKSLSKRDKSVSFHAFPKHGKVKVPILNKLNIIEKVDVRDAWILKLKMGKPVSSSMKVCSKHFLPEDYIPGGIERRKHRFLKNIAVPSQNLPNTVQERDKTSRLRTNRKIDQEKKIPGRVETEKNVIICITVTSIKQN